jgi:hypothetical protein
MTTAMPATLL